MDVYRSRETMSTEITFFYTCQLGSIAYRHLQYQVGLCMWFDHLGISLCVLSQ